MDQCISGCGRGSLVSPWHSSVSSRRGPLLGAAIPIEHARTEFAPAEGACGRSMGLIERPSARHQKGWPPPDCHHQEGETRCGPLPEHAVPGITLNQRRTTREPRALDHHPGPLGEALVQRPRAAHLNPLIIAKAAPWGSRACTIQASQGNSCGPSSIWPPRVVVRSAAAATLRARNRCSRAGDQADQRARDGQEYVANKSRANPYFARAMLPFETETNYLYGALV
jgi:hypothetical protein